MSVKGIFQGMSSWVQLIYLLAFVFSAYILLAIILFAVLLVVNTEDSIGFLRFSLFISGIVFLLPPVLWAYFFNGNISGTLKVNKIPAWYFLVFGCVLIIAIQPFINFVGYYNENIILPGFLADIENSMREKENAAAVLFDRLFTDKSAFGLILNLIIVACVAGICEEFFFRGALQQILGKIINNCHVAIWITAFIFSFIHFQFYGFFPRLLLGALLGYLFLWSGNLWVPVLIHTLNNALAVITNTLLDNGAIEDMEYFGVGDTIWAAILSLLLTVGIMIYMSRIYLRNRIEEGNI